VGDAETNSRQKLRSEDKKAKEAARAAERAEAKAAAEKQERLREETRRRAEKELKDIAAAAEKRARDAAKAAKAAKRREARELKLAKVREKEEHAAIVEERKAWERAEARTRSEREKAEKKEEEEKRRAEKAAAFAEERERKAERAKAVLSSVPDTRQTAESPDAYDVGRREDEESLDSYSEHDANACIALVPGHWIDPGEETGSPGERELNARIADKAHDELVLRGWTVLRPDEFVPPLDWDTYLDWARAQCARGVPLLEIHGQGSGAEMRGRVTGVISQTGLSEISGGSLSPLGDALAERFGRFPMDWRELVVSRVGGAVVESFETEVLERMPLKKREAAMDAIALDIADAVDSTRFTSTPPDDGCSASGCPRA
jgi:chemotaxis protein histidine kinase CheA